VGLEGAIGAVFVEVMVLSGLCSLEERVMEMDWLDFSGRGMSHFYRGISIKSSDDFPPKQVTKWK
jgi:hypothetical protein